MLGLFKRLFGRAAGRTLAIDAFWCESSIKLPGKVHTPLGGNVSVVIVCVDVRFSIEAGNITLHGVQLSRGGTCMVGSSQPHNVASERRGEVWYAPSVCSESQLVEAVQRDLSAADSHLRRIMMAKWRVENRDGLVRSLASALNAHASPNDISNLISAAGRGCDVTFTYTKPKGESETRHVSVQGVSGSSIRALDHKDSTVKNFRIDRITNARNA